MSKDIRARHALTQAQSKLRSRNDPSLKGKRQLIEAPVFKKYGTTPLFTRPSWLAGGEIYFPCILSVGGILGAEALDKFYLYYSSDHSTGAGGIGLATAPRPEGPWTDRGNIFTDTTFGEQTETPCVVYNEVTDKFHMYYHQNYYASGDTGVYPTQATCLALSDDGVNFTIQANPLIKADLDLPGDGHTGYARVYRIGDLWVMKHSFGGTNFSHGGISYSKDGLTWQMDPRPVGAGAEWATDGVDRKIGVNEVFWWRGRFWANVNDNAWASGSGDSTPKVYASPYVGPRYPGAGLFEIIKVGGVGAWDEKSIRNINIFEHDDKLYMFYEGVNAAGTNAFGLAIAEV
jgi:hypothetical protein